MYVQIYTNIDVVQRTWYVPLFTSKIVIHEKHEWPYVWNKSNHSLNFFLPEMNSLTPYFYLNKLLLKLMCHLSDCSFTLHLPAVTKLIPYFTWSNSSYAFFFIWSNCCFTLLPEVLVTASICCYTSLLPEILVTASNCCINFLHLKYLLLLQCTYIPKVFAPSPYVYLMILHNYFTFT